METGRRRLALAAFVLAAVNAPAGAAGASASASASATIVSGPAGRAEPGNLRVVLRDRASTPGAVSLRPRFGEVSRGGAALDDGRTRSGVVTLDRPGRYRVKLQPARGPDGTTLQPAHLMVQSGRMAARRSGRSVTVTISRTHGGRVYVGAVFAVPAGAEPGAYAARLTVSRVTADR